MGTLDPEKTYIYERANGITYAREFGKSERFIIGMDCPPKGITKAEWADILEKAETNPALQKAVEHAIIIYKLSKDYVREN